MWFLLFIMMSVSSPVTAEISDKIPCNHDVMCGKGDCWEGFCQSTGYCVAYWTCA